MSQNAVEQLIGRLVTDGVFRERVRDDVSTACHEHGFALTRDELQLVGRIDFDAFSQLAELVAADLRRSGNF
jgi:hypothetical protein